ncbi:hypothetical protein TOPH_07897 [Tolypocladium ophioglossoides CBS 100239]|uniref:Uncharacterized protein n=1 Tax=Tolypocladium ophioglossoides (strain CBS 100239) TaxID=1163406 RepID=A0A0L0N0A9_TOLOC|nr:hypothetical protein TOPH_07897 [Tolypocladium ophioglossoides CBS 100239]
MEADENKLSAAADDAPVGARARAEEASVEPLEPSARANAHTSRAELEQQCQYPWQDDVATNDLSLVDGQMGQPWDPVALSLFSSVSNFRPSETHFNGHGLSIALLSAMGTGLGPSLSTSAPPEESVFTSALAVEVEAPVAYDPNLGLTTDDDLEYALIFAPDWEQSSWVQTGSSLSREASWDNMHTPGSDERATNKSGHSDGRESMDASSAIDQPTAASNESTGARETKPSNQAKNRNLQVLHQQRQPQKRDVSFVDYFWADKTAPGKPLKIRWNLPGGRPVDLPPLGITCKEFIPRSDATHCITWNAGAEIMTAQLPPYASDNVHALKAEVESFLDKSLPKVLDYILHDIHDGTASATLREAIRYNETYHSAAIDLALRIRCASFCSQGWGSITGPESLGIAAINFNQHGKSGYAAYDRGMDRPLPLSIDHQLDVALLLSIKAYQRMLLKQLSKMIFGKRSKRPWYEIFLTIFVLLSNLEYVHGGSLSFYHAQMKTQNAAPCYSLTQEMIEEYTYSAENLLYHFCSILRGNMGFKLARDQLPEMTKRENLDDSAVEYMRQVLDLPSKSQFPVETRESNLAEGSLPPPDGRWVMRLFDRVKSEP